MFKLIAHDRSLPATGQALEALLRRDEAAFVSGLRALSDVERKQLLAQGAGRVWCNTAKSCDKIEALITLHALAVQDDALKHLPAWSRSRALMGSEGWRAGKPMIALLHVGSGGATVRKYQQRFKSAEGWQKLVEERCISPHAYTAHFGVSLPVLQNWHEQGVLNSSSFAALLRADAAAVMQAVSAGDIAPAEILHRCATEEEAASWAQRFLHSGIGPCPIWMELRANYRAQALELAQQGQLCVDELLKCVPRLAPADMQALRAAGHATSWHALRAGVLEGAEIQQMVDAGAQPLSIVQGGPVAAELARTWVEGAVLDKQAFVKASLLHWQPCDPMPPYHYEIAQRAWGPFLLLRDLPLPQTGKARLAYAARQLAVHLLHREKPLALDAPMATHAAQAGSCLICLEGFDADIPAAQLLGCTHPPVMCQSCLITYVEKTDDAYPVCVHPDCARPVLPEDVVRAGGSATLAHQFALSTIRRQLQHSAVWWACPTRSCVGGTLLGIDVGNHYHCRICEQVTQVRSPTVDWRRDSDKILRLIDGLQPSSAVSEALIRECPKCGVPTEHDGGCAHMKCRECLADWNFSLGLASGFASQGTSDEQMYVPRAGLLTMAGLYEDVAPGPGLYEAVLVNAKRLQLMPNVALALPRTNPLALAP